MNRFTWDLRHTAIRSIPGVYVWGSLQGRKVMPGTYSATLTLGERSFTESFDVLKDPRVEATTASYRTQDDMLVAIEHELTEIQEGVIELRDVRGQVQSVMERTEDHEAANTINMAGQVLTDELDAVEDTLVQKRTVDGQTVINWSSRLNFHYIRLHMSVDGAQGVVTQGSRALFADLSAQWRVYQARLAAVLGPQLEAFNQLIRSQGIPAIMVPPRRRELIP